jgi:hypothetical protein
VIFVRNRIAPKGDVNCERSNGDFTRLPTIL